MEALELCVALIPRRDRRLEGDAPATAVAVWLLPELPVRSFGRIDLLEWEIAPADLKPIPQLVTYALQPDRCTPDERSAVVEKDVEGIAFLFVHLPPPSAERPACAKRAEHRLRF